MIAAEGYPENPVKGEKIKISEAERTGLIRPGHPDSRPGQEEPGQAYVLHAGTAIDAAGDLVSAGGRVLNVVGSGPDIASARDAAYRLAATISLRGGWYRHDIAAAALAAENRDPRRGPPGGPGGTGPSQGGSGGMGPPGKKSRGVWGDRSPRDNRAMIERYTLPEMGRVWSEAHKYELWCRVETLVLEAQARAGTVPAESVEPVRSAPPPTPEAVAAIEAVTDHDVIAFLTAWADNTTPRSAAAYVHYGMTSSDLLDTALAIQLTEATDLLAAKATRLVAALRDHALEHAGTLRPGRTHGIHAEPDSWGHRVADFAFAMARSRDRIVRARDAVAVGTLSGPVGSYSNIDPAIEAEVMPALGLRPAPVATQVVMRDGIAEWVSALALAATVGEAVALEVRHGQRTEVRELAEPFRSGQKGSSSMPHKRNPIRSERIAGLARVIRGYVTPVTEGIPLWHERDISHSSAERIALPDAAIATDYLLHLTIGLIEGLTVDAARMRANLDATGGLIYSSAVLLDLVSAGMTREDAYALVQAAAMDTWDNGTPFRDALRKQAATRGQPLPEDALDSAFRPERYTERLGPVFERLARLS